jgi:hypothetical protein
MALSESTVSRAQSLSDISGSLAHDLGVSTGNVAINAGGHLARWR